MDKDKLQALLESYKKQWKSFKKEKLNFSVYGYKTDINFTEDLTLNPLIYPINVIVTNRIVNSPISRSYAKRQINFPVATSMKDVSNITKNVGFKGLFMGAGAQALTYSMLNVHFFGGNSDQEYEHPIGFYLCLLTIPLFNPL